MTQTTLALGCAVVAVVLIGLFIVLRLTKARAIAAVRRAAPRVVAEVRAEYEDNIPFRMLYVANEGDGIAYNLTVSALIPDDTNASYTIVPAAEHGIEALGVNEARYVFGLSFPARSYARNVRLRYLDAFGNKYITEYRSIDEAQLLPIFREPWLGREYGFASPQKSSAEVSWPVENYERC
jgi:hypothetical protein